jgi:hypothetical protein
VNLREVRERREPPPGAAIFLGLGTVFLGGAAVAGYGVFAPREATGERVGLGIATLFLLGLGAFSMIEGFYRALGTAEEHVLYPVPPASRPGGSTSRPSAISPV